MNHTKFLSALLGFLILTAGCSGTPRKLLDNTITEACRQQCWNGKSQAASLTECLKKCDAPRD